MVTKRQVEKMRKAIAEGQPQHAAAACGGMSERTAWKYARDWRWPEELRKRREGRTRRDPFATVWEEARALLERAHGLEAKTVFAELVRRHPGVFTEGQLRTLQRRVKEWRATAGPRKEVMFAQEHRPGELGAYDFTCMNELMVTLRGVHYKHDVFHFVLTYSNWEWARRCHGETFENVSEGLQGALWELGGVPGAVRSDNLTAAVQTIGREKKFQARYAGLLRHCGMRGSAINAGKANENGDAESSHHQFKSAMEQALLLRGSRAFESEGEYEEFMQDLVARKNSAREAKVKEERALLGVLPARRLEACRVARVRVGAGSTISVERNVYSVDSRLIREHVETRTYAERIEVWYGQKKLEEMPRLLGRGGHRIEYRHIIDWLMRKPGAFAAYRYRDDLFPGTCFRMAYDQFRREQPLRAVKEYLGILDCAAKEGEARTRAVLETMLAAGVAVSATAVRARVAAGAALPEVTLGVVAPVNLAVYDVLLERTAGQEAGHERAA